MESAGNQNELGIPLDKIRQISTNLVRNYSNLSPHSKDIIIDIEYEVLDSIGTYQTPSNKPIYAVPKKENNRSRNETPPPLPLSPPSSNEGDYMDMRGNDGSHGSTLPEGDRNFQRYLDSGSRRLNSGGVSEDEIKGAVNRSIGALLDLEVTKELEDKIKTDRSFSKKIQEKWNRLSNKDKAVLGFGTAIVAVGAPVALPILATVAAVAGLAVAIIGGLKLATPSKEEFKKTGQEIKHSAKSAANILPGETNLEKLWKSAHKPGVTAENQNLKPFLEKYCFPDQNPGEKIEVKFDPDKIEALKAAVKEVSLNLDIDRMVRKGKSKIGGDYVQGKSNQVHGNEGSKFVETVSDIATTVMTNSSQIESEFKSKLAEIKQAKATEAAAKKENSPFSRLKRSSSHTENVDMSRRESSSSQDRGNSI